MMMEGRANEVRGEVKDGEGGRGGGGARPFACHTKITINQGGEWRYRTGNGDTAAANDDNVARKNFFATMKINDEDEIIALSPPALKNSIK